ncbi:MAG: hypothetical protein V7K24_15755 [Nostoc sp.]
MGCNDYGNHNELPGHDIKPRFQPEAGNATLGGSAAFQEAPPLERHSQSETGNETI